MPSPEKLISRDKIVLDNYSTPCIEAAIFMGYKVYMGFNRIYANELKCDYDVKFYNACIYRNLLDFKNNFKAYKNLMQILINENIDVIHCNSPIGGILGRLCGKKANVSKIIYTAHGFHFCKGAPIINLTLFKWAEMLLAHYTDAIITINKEDFEAAKKFKLRNNGKVYYLPGGVGVDTAVFNESKTIRKEILQLIKGDDNSILIISVGDLNKNKNNEVVIKALSKLKNNKIHYLICGLGYKKNYLFNLAKKNNIEKNIHFLGYRTDVPQLLKSCDIFIMMSYREGLSRSLMEAMAAGLPCIVSKIRGNVDLIENGKGGYLVDPNDFNMLTNRINLLAENASIRTDMRNYNLESVKNYDVKNIKLMMKNIYLKEL